MDAADEPEGMACSRRCDRRQFHDRRWQFCSPALDIYCYSVLCSALVLMQQRVFSFVAMQPVHRRRCLCEGRRRAWIWQGLCRIGARSFRSSALPNTLRQTAERVISGNSLLGMRRRPPFRHCSSPQRNMQERAGVSWTLRPRWTGACKSAHCTQQPTLPATPSRQLSCSRGCRGCESAPPLGRRPLLGREQRWCTCGRRCRGTVSPLSWRHWPRCDEDGCCRCCRHSRRHCCQRRCRCCSHRCCAPHIPLLPTRHIHLQPHVDSYDYFLGEGMQHVIESMDGVEIEHPQLKTRHRFWFENPAVGRPIREDTGAAAGGDQRLFPRECREAVSCGAGGYRVWLQGQRAKMPQTACMVLLLCLNAACCCLHACCVCPALCTPCIS